MTDDLHKCRTLTCQQQVSLTRRPTGFCWNCESAVQRDLAAMSEDVDHTLRLEAEFIQWCEDHNQPHPHE